MPSRSIPIEHVAGFIDRHLDQKLTLTRLSREAGVSPCHFQRVFAAAMGISASKRIRLLRLKQASRRLVFSPTTSITDIALDAGFESAESLSRAFRLTFGQSPREFRRAPDWNTWREVYRFQHQPESEFMNVEIVDFPETRVAALEHLGPAHLEFETVRKFIAWRIANRLPPDRHQTFGVYYNDPRTTPPDEFRMEICVSLDRPVEPNPEGVYNSVIAGGRYAVARHTGARENIPAARYLHRQWLPQSGETLRPDPIFFHYVNVGPNVREHEMITDVYLPLL
jgi:AraC family transcriptional regulator